MSIATEAFRTLTGRLFLDGAHVPSEATTRIEVVDPATEEVVGAIADATDAEVDRAVDRANAAQRPWRRLDARTRAELLHEVARRIRAAKPAVAELLTREMGKPYKEAADEVEWCVTAVDYLAEAARHDMGKVCGPVVPGQFEFSVKEPLGTVAVILPFNYPLVLLCWEAAAALATGNAVVIKPHEYTSLTTLRFVEAFKALPAGLVQVVTGSGRVGERLVRSSGIHGVAFTGSVPIAQAVARDCAESFKRCLIEASGNDPFIVMPSAPLDVAARGAAFAAYLNCGQVCTSAERFFVHEAIHDQFVEALAGHARRLRIGNGLQAVDLGPMASARQRERYEAVLARSVKAGARVVTGGGRPSGLPKGWFAEPTVLADVQPDNSILQEEPFGPVAPVCRVKDLDEAIALANRSRFGLGANIYTRDLAETMRAVEEIEAGMVWVNAPLHDNDAGPFGGRKLSGSGRQLGSEGLDQFRHTKFVMIDPAAKSHDFWWFPYADDEAHGGAGTGAQS